MMRDHDRLIIFSSYSRILELIDTLNDIQIVLKHLNIDINQLKYVCNYDQEDRPF